MQEITRTADEASMYRAGLTAGMAAYARGDTDHEAPMVSPSPLVQAYGIGYRDADDDSDEPRPDDEDALRVVAADIYQELERIDADVSAWPDYGTGRIFLEDSLTSESHVPETLLATLRSVPKAAGTDAMWSETSQVRRSAVLF